VAKRTVSSSATKSRSSKPSTIVRLVTPGGPIEIAWPKAGSVELTKLQQQVMEWTHIVRNRARWATIPALAGQQDQRAREFLKRLGVTEAQRKQLADAGTLRISMPWASEDEGWEARILPWEFVLPAATRDLRSAPLVIVRALMQARKQSAAAFKKVLFVESAPGVLQNDWDFGDERRLVQSYTKGAAFKRLVSPTLAELAKASASFKPDIIHLAGFDSHQGLELVDDPSAESAFDGYLLAGTKGVEPVPAIELAGKLIASPHPPTLVFCNIWNSAGRVAPLLVASGARSAIGFQDGIDDALAEIFVGNFYRVLTRTRDLEAAFQEAWQTMSTQAKPLRGTGIVLWQSDQPARAAAGTRRWSAPPAEHTVLRPESLAADEARELLPVSCEPELQISYGLLHNDRDLFRKFVVRNLSDRRLMGLEVHVELHSNEGTYPYRRSFTVDQTGLDLQRIVRIALTSNFARAVNEIVRTSLYVHIKWGPHDIFRETYPVTMAPVDQWTDTDADRIFLPSYMFPRDRAVNQIIRNAEQFMTALRDDPTAGFDGYQQSTGTDVAPTDAQVQALWYSIVYRVPASYINPPPTYAVASQRIRTPSEIIGGGFGTCIDLALMLASCLEAIEIHPVIFVLADHAFPGYWRSEGARTTFCRNIASSASHPGTAATAVRGSGASAKKRPGAPWCYDSAALVDIRKAITNNQLIPIESVGLSERASLRDSIANARDYFAKEEEERFLLMLDVRTAREKGVTPLPLGPREP
jgi:hypothetical protein